MKSTQKMRTRSTVLIIITLWVFSASPAFSTTAGEITQALTCTCGCNMLVSACEGSMECTAAKQITDEVIQKLGEGQSKDEIIQYFVGSYGERILAAPTKKGFNLTAWILPFFAIALGGAGIYIFLNRCLASRKDIIDGFDFSEKKQTTDKKYLDQFEKELTDFTL
jgi:cytochrome c-type biogenesis protein CcmH